MTKRGTIYGQNSITYWPNYTTITGCMSLLGLVAVGLAIMAIDQIFCHDIDKIVFPALALLVSFLLFYFAIRIKGMREKKVVIDANGLVISPKQGVKTLCISWAEVTEIKYEHQSWYGLEALIITYRKPNEVDSTGGARLQYLRLPLRSVERDRIKQIVPHSIPFV